MSEERKKLRRLRRIQTIVIRAVILLGVFGAGLLVGKTIGKNQVSEPINTEEVTEVQSEQPTTEVVSEEASTEEAVAVPETISGNSVSVNATDGGEGYKPTWNEAYKDESEKMKLADREAIRSSFDETIALNLADKEVIGASNIDFSNMKMVCLGDSITEGVGGATPYPTFLKDILGAKEVINCGIGGSTICSDHDDGVQAMSDRNCHWWYKR